ncbi:hypothetical protein [Mycobacterium sp. ACS4331]|uniref:hypothetical protein n=1 Tax=Mycobacterium sp. ACS4331 TaxID=1834121 RepID=UPI0007FC3FC4|nr:hypothetical protein [Mycobacterium sp. ACS4331]OBF11355.1 hypothetical protein A5727_20750 [Mycobacterium sp. ACS4331]
MRIRSASLAAFIASAGVLLAPPAGAEPGDPAPSPDPAGTAEVQAAPTPAASDPAAPEGVPHLPSPDHLPPGASAVPVDREGRGVSYLRDLWHAVQTQEISGAGALLLLTQRPMNPDSAPPGVPAQPVPPPSAPAAGPGPEPAAAP